ncbi:MAG: GNAT family N-acetyltransferase, partial [Candidatus Poribacteria bacterium]|nr:GNAT family N-acetyltransferase [Candidatus Poribacteria bacterium]
LSKFKRKLVKMIEPDNFACHNVHLETEHLKLRPFKDADFDTAVPFYRDPEFLNAIEESPPDEPVTKEYLKKAGKFMRDSGFLFAIVEKASGRAIGEVCLQWMNLERAKIAGEKIMRLPIAIWDKSLWGKGYGKEVVRCLMAHAFEKLEIDRFCPVDVPVDNVRSQALWRSLGLSVSREADGGKMLDYEITRAEYEKIN